MKLFWKIRQLFFLFLISYFFSLFTFCSQKKNTFVNRKYHSLTAHYNGLYWAKVNLNEGIDNVEKSHKDDYSKILPVFKYGDDKIAKANFPQFDKAIEKNSKMVQYHSMLIKGKEYCKWIDRNYITMGKAHFYKRDYYASVEVFEYVVKMFPNNDTKYEAFLWMVRAFNQMNSVIKTEPILDLLEHDKKFPKNFLPEYHAVKADYYIRTEQYKNAVYDITKAITLTKKKTLRGRYIYILAQLYEMQEDLKKASLYYSQSAEMHSSYEMEFNAKLSYARTFQMHSGADTKELKKKLNKMLKDEKNKEYIDQVYYALGEISMKENDIPSAINYFKLSARSSVANIKQKSLSYLRIADIYFEQHDYKFAQIFYDSTMTFLPKDHKSYEQVKNKKESLTKMTKYMNTITAEDSLLKVATMDTVQIHKLIDDIIAKLIENEEKKKKAKEEKEKTTTSVPGMNPNNPWQTASASSGWYFYNPSTISFGISEFYKIWGNRQIEDNWRRSNKETVFTEQLDKEVIQDTSQIGKIADNKTRTYYLKNIPFTNEQKIKSHQKIVDAYYGLGGTYKEQLQDNANASETFEELLKQYPGNKYTLNLYYQLYRIYLVMNNDGKANFYKDKILNEYPNSEYARIIKNPDYQKALKASKSEIEKYYTETLAAYHTGKYNEVIAMANRSDSFYSSSDLMPKFALLRAYSIGKTYSTDVFEKALQRVIAKYPKDETKVKAQEILDHIQKMKAAPIDSSAKKDTVTFKSPYNVFKDSTEQLCIIIISDKKTNINDLKVRISNFNNEYFRLITLNIDALIFDDDKQIISIKKFSTKQHAMDYYDLINQDSKVFQNISPADYKLFPITTDNFVVLYKEKKVDEYQKFFLLNYSK
ncbi:MAG: tetratricopeptide repeat protein [Bacteroidota bacterium]